MVEKKAAETIQQYDMIRPGGRVVVGLSGGADSVCLLLSLMELSRGWEVPVRIRAVHVHHGLRKTADRDADYVRELCSRYSIPLEIVRVDAAAEASRRGMSVEEAGRELRYEAFASACLRWDAEEKRLQKEAHSCSADDSSEIQESRTEQNFTAASIAVAHHMEDRAETVLFNLCRGSSLAGLAGIRPVSMDRGIRVIRPLIECTREEIEAFLSARGIAWCSDETNEDENITRNFIRRRILPALTEHVNRASAAHIARTAGDLEEAEAFLEEETREAVRSVCRKTESGCEEVRAEGAAEWFSVSGIAGLPAFLQKRVLYQALTDVSGRRKDITETHIEELLRLMKTGGSGSLDLPYGVRAVKEYDRLYFVRRGTSRQQGEGGADAEIPSDLSGGGDVSGISYPTSASFYAVRTFPFQGNLSAVPTDRCTKWIDYDTINRSLQFRTREPGDVIVLDMEGHVKKLSRVMIDLHIPERLRDTIVLPMAGSHVIWVPGYRIGADCRIDAETKTVLEIRCAAGIAGGHTGRGSDDTDGI